MGQLPHADLINQVVVDVAEGVAFPPTGVSEYEGCWGAGVLQQSLTSCAMVIAVP
jgi:hypothetical protein